MYVTSICEEAASTPVQTGPPARGKTVVVKTNEFAKELQSLDDTGNPQ